MERMILDNNPAQSICPDYMTEDVFEMEFSYSKEKAQRVWHALQQRETFVKSQCPPYKVEFVSESQSGPFKEGELNIHHGPFMSVHGQIGEVRDDYRDLKYFYGSYIISFRFFRPHRLEFFRVDEQTIKLKLTTYVRPWLKSVWRSFNYLFWKMFGITFIA